MKYAITFAPEAQEGLAKLKRSTKKHRLVYRIFETEVYVDVLSAYGHYNDK